MFKSLESGILDKTRLFSNILMVILLCGNVYLTTQFIQNLQRPEVTDQTNITLQIKSSRALKDFINKVLNTQDAISFTDRVSLENDMLQINDPVVTTAWNAFVNSKTAKEGQTNAVKLMSLLVDRV